MDEENDFFFRPGMDPLCHGSVGSWQFVRRGGVSQGPRKPGPFQFDFLTQFASMI